MPTLLRRISEPVQDSVADLAPPGPRKRLAGRPAGEQLYIRILDELRDPCDALGLAKIPVEGQAPEVVPVCLSRLRGRGRRPAPRDSQPPPVPGSGRRPH